MAERRWPRSSRDPSAKLASQEDFLQVRLSGFEPGSPRYERCGGLLALHVELATLSIHLTPKTLLPVGNYALSVAAGMGQMGRQFLSEVNPPDDSWIKSLPDTSRFGELPPKGPFELRLRAVGVDVSLHDKPPKAPPTIRDWRGWRRSDGRHRKSVFITNRASEYN